MVDDLGLNKEIAERRMQRVSRRRCENHFRVIKVQVFCNTCPIRRGCRTVCFKDFGNKTGDNRMLPNGEEARDR